MPKIIAACQCRDFVLVFMDTGDVYQMYIDNHKPPEVRHIYQFTTPQ